MSLAAPIFQGSCLCGGIHYEIHGEIGDVIQCHCQRCRKANGTALRPMHRSAAQHLKLLKAKI